MLFPCDMRLPAFDTFASVMTRAIRAFCDAIATTKRQLEVFFFGSSISVSVSVSVGVGVGDGVGVNDDARSGHSPPRSRRHTAPNEFSSFVSIPLAATSATTTTTTLTTMTTITLTTATSSTVFTTNGVCASIAHDTTVLPTGCAWMEEDTASVVASVAALCANSASADANAEKGMSSISRCLPEIRSLLSQVKWPRCLQRVGTLDLDFVPDEGETEGEFVVFVPPRTFQRAGEYDLTLVDAADRITNTAQAMSLRRFGLLGEWESFLMRPNPELINTLERIGPQPALSPQHPVDPVTEFCSCGSCPNGIAATPKCKLLTIFRREQRFRRRATSSPAVEAIKHRCTASFTRLLFGRVHCW